MVGDVQKQVSSSMDARLNLQSERIDNVNIAVEKAQKTAKDNSDMLENLLIGIENMSENVKQFREEMEEWRNSNLQEANRVYQEIAADLLQEVSLTVPAVSEPEIAVTNPMTSNPVSVSQNPAIGNVPVFQASRRTEPQSVAVGVDPELQEIRERVSVLQKPYPGAPMIISAGAPAGFYFQSRDQAQAMAISRPPVSRSVGPHNVDAAHNQTGGPNTTLNCCGSPLYRS